jgi:HK97 gp10 family phage protein
VRSGTIGAAQSSGEGRAALLNPFFEVVSMADLDIEIVTDIEGLDELEEALTSGAKRAVKKFLRRAEMRAAKPLVESAEQYAPELTGALSMDIHRTSVTSDGELTIRVGPSARTFYGIFDEFGTEHQAATHWLENSARAVQDDVLQEFYDALTEGLEEMKG